MGTIAETARAATRRPGAPCSVAHLLDTVDDDVRADLQEALDDPTISARALHSAIAAAELDPPGFQQIGHHRRRTCGCFR